MREKQGRKNRIKRRIRKGIISIVLVVALIMQNLPVPFLGEYIRDKFNAIETTKAQTGGPVVNLDSIQAIVNYSKKYDASHKNDTIIITYSNIDTGGYYNGFQTMATSQDAAFNGTIQIDAGVTLNLPSALFDYVTDDVAILDISGQPTTLFISRTANVSDEPLFAKHVIHTRASGSATWSFRFEKFYDPETQNSYIYNYSGFIGTLEENANVTITELVNNNINGSTVANISATGDIGLVCGKIEKNAILQIDSIVFGTREISAEEGGGRGIKSVAATQKDGSEEEGESSDESGKTKKAISETDGKIGDDASETNSEDGDTDSDSNSENGESAYDADSENEETDVDEALGNGEISSDANSEDGGAESDIDSKNENTALNAGPEDGEEGSETDSENGEGSESGLSDNRVKAPAPAPEVIVLGTKDYYVESTASGHAGGLVGHMADGSQLILGVSLLNPQKDAQSITANNGYAGGIVGYCNGGTVVFNTSYVVTQIISGSKGSGAIAGYYSTISTVANNVRYAISTDNIILTNTATIDEQSVTYTCEVNGTGNCGGLFGDVLNDGDMTITGTSALSVNHGAGEASSFGGMIGTYTAKELADSLTISASGMVSPSKTNGTVTQYGGLIGIVAGDTTNEAADLNAAYVKVSGVNITSNNASATSNFGGVIGRAAASFIELDGASTIVYSGVSTTTTFAGIVGDIGDGVLYLRGSIDLSGAPTVGSAAASSGQVVGFRDCGLVFAQDGWTMTRSTKSQTLDDVGSWGEIIRFDASNLKQTDVLTISEDHYVTLAGHVASMSSLTDFAKTALNIQLNKSQTTGVLRCDSASASSVLLGTSSELEFASSTVSIDLSGTGITGLTRDNVKSNDANSYITFKGTFDGNGGSISLATGEEYFTSTTAGNGTIYRHQYNGLFGKTNGATIKNLKIGDGSSISVNAKRAMYIGNIIGQATSSFTLENVEICSKSENATTTCATLTVAGSSANVGGMIGNLSGAGTVSIESSKYDGCINCAAGSSVIGGLIGDVTNSDTFDITIDGTTVSGSITSSASGNGVGGAIGKIDTSDSASSGRKLGLNSVSISGLNMNVTGASGGFLGYQWYKTDIVFKTGETMGVTVNNASTLVSTGNTAGLVYTATGYWKVNAGGINLTSLKVTANSAESFGLLVNEGIDTSAIYLELAPGAYSVTKAGVNLALNSVSVFDELVAYSASGDVSNNGQGVISIATDGHALLKMNDSETGATYQHQTAFLDTNTSLINNSHTRYYYNLDAYRSGSITNAQKLLMWSVYQYANSTIQAYFSIGDVNNLTGVDAAEAVGDNPAVSEDQFDMRGYSYYPVDLTDSLTITNGNIKLWNSEFDVTETSATDNRLSSENNSQHYLIHNSLFRNVSGTFEAIDIKLDGKVNKIGDYCGVLVMGTVSSEASGKKAQISIDGLLLDGVRIDGTVTASNTKPLLINKAGKNVVFDIKNVSNNSTSYTSIGAGIGSYVASSLLGIIGNPTARDVALTFEGIKLDGRNSSGVTNLPELSSVYHSEGSLFSKSTLVETLAYANNSGSYGVYNYTHDEDWGDGDRNVTYGFEIVGTVENLDASVSKQNKYYGSSDTYTHPTDDSAGAQYDAFTSNFQRYVYTSYVLYGTNHELRVNLSTSSFRGCGTYNDPYIITNGDDLQNIASLINGTFTSSDGFTISVPTSVTDNNKSASWCTGKSDHVTYTTFTKNNINVDESTWSVGGTSISYGTLREYLAGAYYQIDPSDPSLKISLTSNFDGISNTTTLMKSAYCFHGVIDGTGHTIINASTQPLIVSSNGCVVNNITIEVKPSSAKTIATASNRYKSKFQLDGSGCDFYGAVIGQIFGGDNIIDTVKVKFSGAIVSANNNQLAYTAPIGGYVGVIVNGGLIFRGMSGTASNNEAGLSSNNLVNFPGGNGNSPTNPLASDNTRWLYVNSIIGRVMNGYAITESTSYKPFEDGTRTYSDGSGIVYDGTSFVEVDDVASYTGTRIGVTMKNGTKNYSIADINTTDTSSFTMSGIADDSNIIVSSAQALYIMSLITECGLGKSTSGTYNNETALKPYDEHMSTHVGNYHYVGDAGLATGAAPTAATATTEAQKDYVVITGDKYASADLSAKVPYIVKAYTPKSGEIYPAFDVAGGNDKFFNLILSTIDVFYLPDSYRGLGSLMFGVNISGNLDDFKDNVMHLYSMNGGEKSISLSMNLRVYYEDNYPILKGAQANFKTGFGFINCLQSKKKSTTNEFKNLTILGSVKAEMIDKETGNHVAYTNANIIKDTNPAVAAFVGVPVPEKYENPTAYNINFNNIMIDSMDISGMCYSGGFVGVLNMAGQLKFAGCGADNLKVFAGSAAGGLVGYLRHREAKVSADFSKVNATTGEIENGSFGIISIVSANTDTVDTDTVKHGAGGLIGNRTTGSTLQPVKDNNIDISYVTICNGTSATSGGYIGCLIENNNGTEDIINPNVVPSGGIIGSASKTSIISTDHVIVENLKIYGAWSGGFVGRLDLDNSKITIRNSKVTTDTTPRCVIKSTYNNADAASGGFIGKNDSPAASLITDSILTNYSITGYYNVGGVIGYNSKDLLPSVTMTNIELENHSISGDHNIGGLVGKHSYGELTGYNILINKQTSSALSGETTENNGYIVGLNDSKDIKLVGFSRQGTVDTDKMVGNSSYAYDENYGSGYVVFADYMGITGTDPHLGANDKYSSMQATGINVGVSGDYMEVKKNSYKLKTSESNIEGNRIGETGFIDQPNEAYDPNHGSEKIETWSGTSVTRMVLQGVYIYGDTARNSASQGYYSASINSNGALMKYDNTHPKAIWYFEPCMGGYKIYTFINGVRNYLLLDSTKLNSKIKVGLKYSTTDADIFKIGTMDNNWNFTETDFNIGYVYLQNTDDTHTKYLQFSGSGSGMRYHTDKNDAGKIKLESANTSDVRYFRTTYDSITIHDTTITTSEATSIENATDEEISEYEGYFGTSNTNALYYITEYQRQNKYTEANVHPPYVTTNPRFDIVKDGDTFVQWLTSDGVSNTSYYGSAASEIISEINGANNKRYQNTEMSPKDLAQLTNVLRYNITSIDKAVTTGNPYNGENFPVLVIDDSSTADATVNNYLKLLTNTDFDFYKGFSDGTTFAGDDKEIYNVSITRWKYDNSVGEFVLKNEEASLKCKVNEYFNITANDMDNLDWQISLVDVQFYDPNNLPTFSGTTRTSSGLIAYHLYVPVVVKKMLHYSFTASPASGTTYELSTYPNSYANIVENLGNPITIRISYTYDQTPEEWEAAINSGESVYRYYRKQLEMMTIGGFPDDALIVLVDPNNDVDKYYYKDFKSTSFTTDTSRENYYIFDLNSFQSFTYPLLNDLMNISIDSNPESKKNLVVWVNGTDDPDDIVAKVNSGDESGTFLRYKKSNETGTHAIKVSLKDYQKRDGCVQENYYLSIFTKEKPNDNEVYHYALSCSGNTLGKSYYPTTNHEANYPTIRASYQTPHIFLGNIYTNSVTLTPSDRPRLMSSSNDTLEADLTATVGFTASAVAKGIQNHITNNNVNIYQTFLFSLNELKAGGTNERGILVKPKSINMSDYYVNGVDQSSYLTRQAVNHGSYLELPSSYSIKGELRNKALNPTVVHHEGAEDTYDYTIQISEHVAVSYYDTALSSQFPESDASSTDIGTYMIGYSNISSADNNAVSSHARVNTDGDAANRLWLYYIESDSSVTFSYNVTHNALFENDGNGNYGQLGLDGNELDLAGKNYVQINTAAYYNVYEYAQKQNAAYVKITVELSKKSNYSAPLDIPTYLKDFMLLDKDNQEVENGVNDAMVIMNSADHIYTYIIPKELLKSESADAYTIPIVFKAYSGNNSSFETATGGGLEYSNYKVKVTVGLLQNKSTTEAPMTNTDKYDHIIYTNAKLHSEFIEGVPSGNSSP